MEEADLLQVEVRSVQNGPRWSEADHRHQRAREGSSGSRVTLHFTQRPPSNNGCRTGVSDDPQDRQKSETKRHTLSFKSNILHRVFSIRTTPTLDRFAGLVYVLHYQLCKRPKMRKRGILFVLLPCVRETPAGKHTTDLCCKWYRRLWIYSSAKASSSPVVGSPIAQSRNSDVQRLYCLQDKKNTISFSLKQKKNLSHT